MVTETNALAAACTLLATWNKFAMLVMSFTEYCPALHLFNYLLLSHTCISSAHWLI